MGKALNTKRKFLAILAFIVSFVFLCGGVANAKVTLEESIEDPNTIAIKFDERSDFEKFRDGMEGVSKELLQQKEKFGSICQAKFYNKWLFDLTVVFDKHLCPVLQGNDYVSMCKLFDILARIILSDCELIGAVKGIISANCATIFDKFYGCIYSRFAKVPTGSSGIIFHTDVNIFK